jgi:hypothetical protein
VGAEQPSGRLHWLRGNFYKGGYSPSGFKSDEVGNGSQGRCAAEGTVLEIRLAMRMVVMPMVRRSAAGVGRTELHQERGATRGHEPNGDIGTKDERGQQYGGQHIGSPSVTQPSLHDWDRHHARMSVIVPGRHRPGAADTPPGPPSRVRRAACSIGEEDRRARKIPPLIATASRIPKSVVGSA